MTEYERLEEVSRYLRLSFPKLADAIGLKSPQTFYSIKTGKNKLSKDLATRITEICPTISIEWLLTGKGDMLKPKEVSITQQNEKGDNLNDAVKVVTDNSDLIAIISKKDEQIDRLLSIIERMQGQA